MLVVAFESYCQEHTVLDISTNDVDPGTKARN